MESQEPDQRPQPPGMGPGDSERVSLTIMPVSQLDTAVDGGGLYNNQGNILMANTIAEEKPCNA